MMKRMTRADYIKRQGWQGQEAEFGVRTTLAFLLLCDACLSLTPCAAMLVGMRYQRWHDRQLAAEVDQLYRERSRKTS